MCVHLVVSDSLWPYGLWPPRHLCPWDFSRQEYCSGLPFPTPGNLPNPGIEPSSFVSPALAGGFFITASPGKPKCSYIIYLYILVHHGSELRWIEHDFLQLDMCNQQAVLYSKYNIVAVFHKCVSIKKCFKSQNNVLVLYTCMGFISLFLQPLGVGKRQLILYTLAWPFHSNSKRKFRPCSSQSLTWMYQFFVTL